MNLLLLIAEKHIPVYVKKKELYKLVQLTASAFSSQPPMLKGLAYDVCLKEYALFTKKCADHLGSNDEHIKTVQFKLFQQAFDYGKAWRKRFSLCNENQVMRAAKVLYRAIGIEFNGSDQGTVEISKCLFSQYYSPATCRIISSLDAGIMAGLAGGGVLFFQQRITEGSDRCMARFEKEMVG